MIVADVDEAVEKVDEAEETADAFELAETLWLLEINDDAEAALLLSAVEREDDSVLDAIVMAINCIAEYETTLPSGSIQRWLETN